MLYQGYAPEVDSQGMTNLAQARQVYCTEKRYRQSFPTGTLSHKHDDLATNTRLSGYLYTKTGETMWHRRKTLRRQMITHTQGGRHVKGVNLYVKVLNSSFQLLNMFTGLIKYLPAVLT